MVVLEAVLEAVALEEEVLRVQQEVKMQVMLELPIQVAAVVLRQQLAQALLAVMVDQES
jgi:hypothetical protein